MTATHLINRTPTILLSNQTPFHVLFKKDADYSMVRVFGCLAYASTLTARRTKFDPKATPCVFMGYSNGVKGFRLYDIAKRIFFVSRDVLFFEDLFPFRTLKDDH